MQYVAVMSYGWMRAALLCHSMRRLTIQLVIRCFTYVNKQKIDQREHNKKKPT